MLTHPLNEIAIPAVTFETHEWRPRARDLFSNAEVRRQTGQYRSIVTPELRNWSPRLDSAIAADIVEASGALTAFDRYALARLGITNPALGPMAAILLRTESASSSQIEQVTASAKQLALAEIGEEGRTNASIVVGNVRAMESALRLSHDLSDTSILSMHRELLLRQPGLEHEAGRFRDQLVWIGNRDTAGPRGADFIAPQHTLVRAAIADMLAFAKRADVPSLVQIAVTHAQFETIHPFVDGNGRTGRALAQAMLRNKGLAKHTTVPISAGLLRDTASYFDALTAFRQGDAGPIIRGFANACRFAAVSGTKLVDDLDDELNRSRELLKGLRPQSMAWRTLPLLIGQPVINSNYLKSTLGLSDVTTARTLSTLTDRGVLVERTGRTRNRVWHHRGVLDVLDRYAESISAQRCRRE